MSRTLQTPHNIILIQDDAISAAKNGQPANGKLIETEAKALQYYQHAGRPIFHFWGGSNTVTNKLLSYRFIRPNILESGGRHFRGRIAAVPFNGNATTTQGVTLALSGGGSTNTPFPITINDGISTGYPENTDPFDLAEITQDSVTGLMDHYSFGTDDASSPYLAAGCFWEDYTKDGDTDLTVTTENFRAGSDILAVKTGASSTQDRLAVKFKDVWRFRRPSIGSCWERGRRVGALSWLSAPSTSSSSTFRPSCRSSLAPSGCRACRRTGPSR